VVLLWIPFPIQISLGLKNYTSFGIVQHIEKNSKYKKIENDSQYEIVKNSVMELKNANQND